MSSYAQKLRDPRWQKKRLEVLEAAEWRCEVCFDSESPLHVHHKHYFKGREPWEYEADQLAALCENCHHALHDSEDLLIDVISRFPLDGPRGREDIAYLLAGVLGIEMPPKCVGHLAMLNIGKRVMDEYFGMLRPLLEANGGRGLIESGGAN